MMNGQTALLSVRQMAEADRLTIAAGKPAIDMMESAGGAVAREIERRWTARPVIVLCGLITTAAMASSPPGILSKPAGPFISPCWARAIIWRARRVITRSDGAWPLNR